MDAMDLAGIESDASTAEQEVNRMAPRFAQGENDYDVQQARTTIREVRDLVKKARTHPAMTASDFVAPLNQLSQVVGHLADLLDAS